MLISNLINGVSNAISSEDHTKVTFIDYSIKRKDISLEEFFLRLSVNRCLYCNDVHLLFDVYCYNCIITLRGDL